MTPAARVQAAIEILDLILAGNAAEAALTGWARRSRFAGSKDRHAVRDHVFDALRTKRSSAAKSGTLSGRGLMIGSLANEARDLDTLFSGQGHGPAVLTTLEHEALNKSPELSLGMKVDLPDWILPEFERSVGEALTNIGTLFQNRAPVYLRVNQLKANRDAVLTKLIDLGIDAAIDPLSSTAIRVEGSPRGLRNLESFLEGEFEFQDAGSQAVVDELGDLRGKTVLDYCSGGGGKSLAMAALGAEVTACDLDPKRMKELPDRARRAGAEITCLDIEDAAKNAPYDIVLCDVPCSGSGAWRRQPDAKWRLTQNALNELSVTQKDILSKAVPLVAADGFVAYVTCSLLRCENEDVVDSFLQENKNWALRSQRRISPVGGSDGFFCACLTQTTTQP